ncbi:Metallophos domain-containing protein/Metallophos_C domain-containing protein [Cephalotus follicularis]|uniref:Purple acid phosphatase n=1 Tax=Cephalotus follicularis TaxID=3775 RepID=A0A1Q3AQ41_CEPFO|nr:Metallophos domain-containing protein/Metallophos_C domain-containing protein [Cephalotus follicularis]
MKVKINLTYILTHLSKHHFIVFHFLYSLYAYLNVYFITMAIQGLHFLFVFIFTSLGILHTVSSYNRPLPRKDIIYLAEDLNSTSPQQVHISVYGEDEMRISWITNNSAPATVDYGTSPGVYTNSTNGSTSSYNYGSYQSGEIYDVVIGPLQPNTIYYYRCSSNSDREFNFKTPPAQLPINFAVSGDLGQTDWTNSTLNHISNSNYDMLILPGDLSYADTEQDRWDSFGHLVEPLASQRPWMVTQGNHEIESTSYHPEPFTAYNARWRMPFEDSNSTSNLYYSFDVAGVHVVMLGSYTDFDSNSDQYIWLQADLGIVDRSKTPWIVVLLHAPWYNSNKAHQGEYQSVDMKASMEGLLYQARVDVVFAGHVHAYERFTRVYNDTADNCGLVYITIGDGGNREGLATKYIYPQPEISLFREASFGHGQFEVMNATHALWTWHRNEDDESVVADSTWLMSHSSDPDC